MREDERGLWEYGDERYASAKQERLSPDLRLGNDLLICAVLLVIAVLRRRVPLRPPRCRLPPRHSPYRPWPGTPRCPEASSGPEVGHRDAAVVAIVGDAFLLPLLLDRHRVARYGDGGNVVHDSLDGTSQGQLMPL